jgi:F-type H+-transporting ATPase subunit b
MPQLSQLSTVYLSQFLWLAIALGFIFFVIARGMVPKIQATVDARESRIAGDLEAAQKARAAADETEAAWRARIDAARADAARIAQEAKQASAQETEKKIKAAADKINRKVETAQAKIRDASTAARAEIEALAAEAAQEMVRRLTGIAVDKNEAAQAVKADLNVYSSPCRYRRRGSGARGRRAKLPRPRSGGLGCARGPDRVRAADLEAGAGGRRKGARFQDRVDPRSARRGRGAPQGSRGAEGRI